MSTPHHALTPPASAQPFGSRLEALALRHSIGGLLRSGCSSPPEVFEHEEFAADDFAFPVPGLQELAAMHVSQIDRQVEGMDLVLLLRPNEDCTC